MKNTVRFLLMISIAAFAVLLTACVSDEDKDSYGLAKVTTFPELSLTDEDKILIVSKGAQYAEPGYSAFVGEDDITGEVTIAGSVDTNVEGMYILTYTATNAEGYSMNKSRKVFVAEVLNSPVAEDLSGTYTSSVIREQAGTAPISRGPYTQVLTSLGDGFYYVQDFLGGYYWIGANYGTAYAYDGIICVDAAGVVTLKWSNNLAGWADGAIFVGEAVYEAGKLTFSSQMGSAAQYTFNVTLEK